MRILFVSAQFPEDPSTSVSGAFQRMRMWLDAMRSRGADIEVLFLTESTVDTRPESAAGAARRLAESWNVGCSVALCPREAPVSVGRLAERYLAPMIGLSRQGEFRSLSGRRQRDALGACLGRSPDVVVFFYLHGIMPMSSRPHGARMLLDLPDLEHPKFLREVSQPPWRPLKPLRYLWLPALWWGERQAIARVDTTFVCSEGERRYLRGSMGLRNVEVIPNAVPYVSDRGLGGEPNVLFLGTYGYPPNRVAADVLIREVWPRVSGRCPEARLLIAGARPELLSEFHGRPAGVEFLGFVPDLDRLYARTRVLCCPIQSGGGTRIKILEAASYGVPVVSTPVGAEGIDLVPDREILLRRSPEEMATACVELLADSERAQRLGALGRDRVRALYSREAVVARMGVMLTGAPPGTTTR